ncbi:hypothetical protein [Sulfuricystis thermophila]|jgi:hypothetical protein|uniref:hypothetical protein n=1 Tax=Sulfuricystis thermophila TaxID=2496847 RepID=UPI0010365198|nr:hypothetical protein [Sulfuricystis thermophila]NWG31657.1 hypothetical protein [Rhodocyclaceae bacterium]
MDNPSLRPRLMTFRVIEFNSRNALPRTERMEVMFSMTPTIEIGLGVPSTPEGNFEAIVSIRMDGKAVVKETPDQSLADLSAQYEARFTYPPGTTETELLPRFEQEQHQYVLAAQAFPLAASHFRRELMSMGFQVQGLPLGL